MKTQPCCSRIVTVLLFALVPPSVVAETTAESAEKVYNAAVDVAKKEFDAKVKVARDKFVVVLKVQMTELTKKGDLDGALKVKSKIAELEAAVVPPPVPPAVNLKDVAGNWTITYDNGVTFVHMLKADGTMKNGETHSVGKWIETDGKIVYTWSTRKEEMTITGNNKCTIAHWPVAGQERLISGNGTKN